MSLLVLPAGQSLRVVAERLGVPLDELQRHAGVSDPEAVLPREQRIEVPDGFLRGRSAKRQQPLEAPTTSARQGGMNTWLAMDIEQKRTRAGGGLAGRAASEDEQEGLAEAHRAYLRFACDDNELAFDLYGQLTVTHSVELRAQAFAGQGCAAAQRHRLFGAPLGRSQPQALSAAKAAQWAAPKHPESLLAMALALGAPGTPEALAEARAELQRGLELAPRAARCWAELAAVHERLEELDDAAAALSVALELEPTWLFALTTEARLARRANELDRALALLELASQSYPHHANVVTERAILLALGGDASADEIQRQALTLAGADEHRALLAAAFSRRTMPA